MILQPYASASGGGSEKGQVKIIKGDLFISGDSRSLETTFESNFNPEIVFVYYMGWDYALNKYTKSANDKTVSWSNNGFTYTPGSDPIVISEVGGYYVAIGTVV